MSIIAEALDCLVSRGWLRFWCAGHHGITATLTDGTEVRMRLEALAGDGVKRITFRLENGDGLTVVLRQGHLLSALYEAKVTWDDPMLDAWGAKP